MTAKRVVRTEPDFSLSSRRPTSTSDTTMPAVRSITLRTAGPPTTALGNLDGPGVIARRRQCLQGPWVDLTRETDVELRFDAEPIQLIQQFIHHAAGHERRTDAGGSRRQVHMQPHLLRGVGDSQQITGKKPDFRCKAPKSKSVSWYRALRPAKSTEPRCVVVRRTITQI
jgi:hypothetical protein